MTPPWNPQHKVEVRKTERYRGSMSTGSAALAERLPPRKVLENVRLVS
jgi:hypothetical protein